jgi:predicted transcriptional regulator
MTDHEIVLKAMQEDRFYGPDELQKVTGVHELAVMKSLITLQAGGLIECVNEGNRPRNRRYRTKQTTLNLEVFGPGALRAI